jgi:hypothetical protein
MEGVKVGALVAVGLGGAGVRVGKDVRVTVLVVVGPRVEVAVGV